MDSVAFHMCLWTDRGVFHASVENTDKCHDIVVFSGWRARCVGGAFEVSLTSCSSATNDFFFAVLDGIVKISWMRILRNCPYRGTLGAFGACTAPRTSHSPSGLRGCHLGVHGYMVQCGVSQVARGLT